MAEDVEVVRLLELPLRGDALGEASAEKIRRKNDENEERVKRMGLVAPKRRVIKLRLVRPDLKVPTREGGYYPQEEFEADPNDMYVMRRVAEGTLMQVTEGSQPAPTPETPPETPPETSPEQPPAE